MPPAYCPGTDPTRKPFINWLLYIWKDDDVVPAAQTGRPYIRVVDALGFVVVIFENPSRPSFIDGGVPWTVKADPGLLDRNRVSGSRWDRHGASTKLGCKL